MFVRRSIVCGCGTTTVTRKEFHKTNNHLCVFHEVKECVECSQITKLIASLEDELRKIK